MKINQIPDIYIELYLLGELPENLRKEMDNLILNNPELNDRINKIKKSNEDILSVYPVHSIVPGIINKKNSKIISNRKSEKAVNRKRNNIKLLSGIIPALTVSLQNILKGISSLSARRYTISIASAAVMIFVIVFLFPGIRSTFNTKTYYDDTVRIKGLDSKLLLYRMKGREVEELKNFDTARKGDIIQAGYIASGNYRYGVILSIDGRGTVTLHLPDSRIPGQELAMNKKILLKKSYELDDSPSFERFIMVLSPDPLDPGDLIEKAKKLANNKDNAMNVSIKAGKNSIEFSIIIKKIH